MPAEPTAANLLAVASYGIGGRLHQIIDMIRLLDELHGPRKLVPDDVTAGDMRCKTCRNTSGKPCPWPCETWMQFAEVLGLRDTIGPATTAFYQALGREKNGARITNAEELVQAVIDERDPVDVELPGGDDLPALTAEAEHG